MEESLKLNHREVVQYLHANADAELIQRIDTLKENDELYAVFFMVLDDLKKTASDLAHVSVSVKQSPGFAESEEMLQAVYAGIKKPDEAGKFIRLIETSPRFYEQLLIKIKQIAPHKIKETVPELNQITMKSDEEILRSLYIDSPSKSAETGKKPLLSDIPAGIKSWFSSLFSPGLRPAYALLLLLIISIGGYRGYIFYHTSYKLSLAENLVREHYQVYMEQETRLTGGYASTGVGTLMGEQSNQTNYQKEALRIAGAVLQFDATNFKAQRFRAKVFIISDELAKADSVLSTLESANPASPEIKNDKGVLLYKKKQFALAESYFRKAIELQPDLKEAWYNLAQCIYKLNRPQETKDALNKYLTLEEDIGWRNAAQRMLQQLE